MDKFWNFFSKYKKAKKPFSKVLNDIYKEVDFIAPDVIKLEYSGIFRHHGDSQYYSKRFNKDINIVKTKVEDVPEENRIRIYLIQDDSTYIILTLRYNNDKKFDMITAGVEKFNLSLDDDVVRHWVVSHVSWRFENIEDDILNDLRDYLIKNDLIGQVI